MAGGKELLVACDGSCLKNPGGATGWAWVAETGDWAAGCQPMGTNQVAELWAVLLVLRDFPMTPLCIQIDSLYAMKCATVWSRGWHRRGWTTAAGDPIKNPGLIKSIYSQMQSRTEPVRFVKVPGHDPQKRWPLNDAADKRAKSAARFALEHQESREFAPAGRQ